MNITKYDVPEKAVFITVHNLEGEDKYKYK
jgi:hypothetical protein